MDSMLPLRYPLPPDHRLSRLCRTTHPHVAGYTGWSPPAAAFEDAKTPRLHVEYWRTHIHVHPAELYLSASYGQQQLQYFTCYDQRVFSEEIIQEWVREIKDATLWYLGQSRSHKTTLQS